MQSYLLRYQIHHQFVSSEANCSWRLAITGHLLETDDDSYIIKDTQQDFYLMTQEGIFIIPVLISIG